jgi:hypothetical protein
MHEPSLKGNMVITYIQSKIAMLINIAMFDVQFRFLTIADSSPAYAVM